MISHTQSKINPIISIIQNKSQIKFRRVQTYTDDEVRHITNFCISNNEGDGWVVKAPYTTNKGCIYFA